MVVSSQNHLRYVISHYEAFVRDIDKGLLQSKREIEGLKAQIKVANEKITQAKSHRKRALREIALYSRKLKSKRSK